MYGEKKARFRMRMLAVGGDFSPDGIFGMHPGDYRKHFRPVAIENDGTRVQLVDPGTTYYVDGHPFRIEGLADLGVKKDAYDDCYQEDSENQIDVILSGSVKAAKRITILQIPARGDGYSPLYSDGVRAITRSRGSVTPHQVHAIQCRSLTASGTPCGLHTGPSRSS